MSASELESSESDGSSLQNNDEFELKVVKKKVEICYPMSTKTIMNSAVIKKSNLLSVISGCFNGQFNI